MPVRNSAGKNEHGLQLFTRWRFDVGFELFFFSHLNFAFITVDNIYHSQNVSSNRNETLTVTCSHSAEMVEFRYSFNLLQLAFWFQTLTVSVTVSCERNP